MASAYSGQTALCPASAAPRRAPPQSNDDSGDGGGRGGGGGGAGVLTASTTLDAYVPPKCLWSAKRGDEKAGGGIVVYKVSSNGKIQPRRLALSADNRTILVSSSKLQSRIKSVKKLFKSTVSGDASGGSPGASGEMGSSGVRKIDISLLDSVQRGQLTSKFRLAKSLASPMPESYGHPSAGSLGESSVGAHSLSLIYRPTSGAGLFGVDSSSLSSTSSATAVLESLDLTVPSDDDFKALTSTLDHLMVLYKRHRCKTPRDLLLLEHHWIRLGKTVDKPVYGGDWASICFDGLGVPLSKARLHGLFDKHCDRVGIDRDDGLKLGPDLVTLLEVVRAEAFSADADVAPRSDILDSILHSAPFGKGNNSENNENAHPPEASAEDVMVAENFLQFLQDEQGESNARIGEVYELFSRLNAQALCGSTGAGSTASGNDRAMDQMDHITKSMFISYLMSDANDIFDPKAGAANHNDMSKSLNQYWINTSHKAYKGKTGHVNEAEGAQPYILALQRGCRCLELDVSDGTGKQSDCVVVRDVKAPSHCGLPIQEILLAVRSFLQSVPDSYPIILSIENNCTVPYQENLFRLLDDILGNEGMIYKPPKSLRSLDALPSPEALRGKVVIKSKRPSPDGRTGTVINDDFDDNIDYGLEEPVRSSYGDDDDSDADEEGGVVVGFDRIGTVLSNDEDVVTRTPQELYDIANNDAVESKRVAESAEQKSFDLQVQTNEAEKHADRLASKVGILRTIFEEERKALTCSPRGPPTPASTGNGVLSPVSEVSDHLNLGSFTYDGDTEKGDDWLEGLPLGREISKLGERFGERMGLGPVLSADERDDEDAWASPRGFSPKETNGDGGMPVVDERGVNSGSAVTLALSGEEGGIEVQDYLNESVAQAESVFVEAGENAAKAASAAAIALANYQEKSEAFDDAENQLYNVVQSNRDLLSSADRAATEARVNREHAETAKQRVATVRQLLENCKGQAKSAETVAGTAQTEAEISAQRADDAYKRAARAQAAAKRDRAMADAETKKEEELGKEVMDYKSKYDEASINYKNAKERLESATIKLSEIEKKIKSIESSSAFKSEYGKATEEHPEDEEIVVAPGSVLAQHKSLMIEMKACLKQVKDAASDKASEEKLRKRSRHMLEEIQEKVKVQIKIAASARRQADHSTSLAEQLAEYAEEEREAANMRKIALDKASDCVEKSTNHGSSVESQLIEAERAAEEAYRLAEESRATAEALAKQTKETKDTTELEERVNFLKIEKEKALIALEAARAMYKEAEDGALESKRRLASNQEIFDKAKKDSAEAVDREAKDKRLRVNAFLAHCKAIELKGLAEEAKSEAADAVAHAAAKAAAARHAKDYRDKKICVKPIHMPLEQSTLIHSQKFRYWGKSLTLPFWHMHSISESAMLDMASRQGSEIQQWKEFNRKYISRVFPSKLAHKKTSSTYLNPMVPWALGCQMVAMNIQGRSDSILLNDGRFRENGSCGYVLKPVEVDENSPSSNLDDSCPDDEIHTADYSREIKIQVLSGSNLPKPASVARVSTNVCVFVSLFDGKTDPKAKPATHVTSSVRGNMFNPVWNEEKAAKFEATKSNVAMLLFQVWNSSDDNVQDSLIGAAAVPLSCLRDGYRSVQLFDLDHTRRGVYGCASLLVRVQSRYLLSRTEL